MIITKENIGKKTFQMISLSKKFFFLKLSWGPPREFILLLHPALPFCHIHFHLRAHFHDNINANQKNIYKWTANNNMSLQCIFIPTNSYNYEVELSWRGKEQEII